MCSLVFYKTFFGVELSFFHSKSKGRILDELRVSFKGYSEGKYKYGHLDCWYLKLTVPKRF